MSLTIVIGLGRSGIGAARLSHHLGSKVIVLEKYDDNAHRLAAETLSNQGIEVQLGKSLKPDIFEPFINDISNIVVSPGVDWNNPTLKILRNHGIRMEGEVNLAWRTIKDIPCIGITGTNGKTTVTTLVNHILNASGLNSLMAGNIGYPASEVALNQRKGRNKNLDWIVLELSSYQIESSPSILPEIGIWTNLTSDHLERHGSLELYRSIKQTLIKHSKTKIFNGDDPDLASQRDLWGNGIWVGTKQQAKATQLYDIWINNKGEVVERGKELFSASALKLLGKHNLQNLLLATAAARSIGIKPRTIEESLNSFPGIPHRLEKIGQINDIDIFNDSKATNYDSAKMGLDAIAHPAIVLAGGISKFGDPTSWTESLKEKACGIILFGRDAHLLLTIIKKSGFRKELICCEDLSLGINLAIEIAARLEAKTILFSPACSSFDQYKNYEERGDHFKKLIQNILHQQVIK